MKGVLLQNNVERYLSTFPDTNLVKVYGKPKTRLMWSEVCKRPVLRIIFIVCSNTVASWGKLFPLRIT